MEFICVANTICDSCSIKANMENHKDRVAVFNGILFTTEFTRYFFQTYSFLNDYDYGSMLAHSTGFLESGNPYSKTVELLLDRNSNSYCLEIFTINILGSWPSNIVAKLSCPMVCNCICTSIDDHTGT